MVIGPPGAAAPGAASLVGMNLQAPELIIILVIVLLVFGGSQLPKLARNLGQAQREFKKGVANPDDDEKQQQQ